MWVGENSEEIVLDPVVSNSYSNSFSVKNKLGFELFSAIEYMSDSDLIKLVTFESVTNEAKLLLLNYQKLGSQHRYFARPEILGPHSLYAASKVEEWLCAYLFAWLAVQPTDILNLKRNNIAIIKNKGGIANIQVKYFKGRAGMQMETMVLNCKYAEGKSILDYMDYYVDDSFFLKINSITTPSLNSFDSVPGVSRSLKHFFLCRSFTSSVLDEHEKRNLVPIFLSAMQKILTSPSRTRNVCSDMETYKKVNKEGWLQPNIFTLGRIKNSAVHSRSDKYRDDNIETDNSHSPETEKRTYLSDSNNDYIDRFGRVLRVVANAMVNLQYAPCSSLDIRTKVEKSIKTTIVEMSETNLSGANVGKYVNYLGIADPPKSEIHIDTNLRDILVLDTPETVVNMLHYIEDATKNQEFLLNDAPEFFYRTVLPNVEWMEWVLSIISTNSLHAGAKAYGNVKSFLPDLFVYELQGGIS
jgi:hypothetical protein